MFTLFKFILFQFFSLSLCAQGYFVAKGRILDSETKDPLSQGYICIPATGFGTAPNLDGDFIFQFPNINLDSEVVVAMMGYKSEKFLASVLKTDSNTIFLEKIPLFDASYGLSDVRIMLQTAIDSIPVNYPNMPVYQNGFYQEHVYLPTVGAIKINEGVMRVERYPNEKEKFEKIKLLRGRSLEWKGQTAKIEGWGFNNGSELVCKSLETNIPELLTRRGMKLYDFRLDSLMTNFDGLPLFIIHFWPLSKRAKGAKQGTIYLEPESKAIVRIEYSLTPDGIKDLININTGAVKITGKKVEAYAQYRLFQHKWRLQESKIVFDVSFEDKLDKKYKIDANILMRYVAFENLPLLKSNIYPKEILLSTNTFPTAIGLSNVYWKPYNYMISNENARKLERNLGRKRM